MVLETGAWVVAGSCKSLAAPSALPAVPAPSCGTGGAYLLRACYAMPNTDGAYLLRACYAMPGTDGAYLLCACCALSGTDGALSPTLCPVLTYCMLLPGVSRLGAGRRACCAGLCSALCRVCVCVCVCVRVTCRSVAHVTWGGARIPPPKTRCEGERSR
eukprot:2509307-Rhodomonas_salina.2